MSVRASLFLSLALSLGASTTAGAAPILAEFSRTANSIADDSIGPAPPLMQVVNNADRVGLVLTLLTDGSTATGNYGQAFTFVSFGHIRILASAESRDGLQKSATADGGLQDILEIVGAGIAGDTYRFAGALSLTGTTTYPSGDPGALSVINAGYHWNAFQDNAAIGGDAQNFTRNSSGFGEEGTDFLGSIIPVGFDFVWGTPIILEMGLGAGVGANSGSPGNFSAASVDMRNSLVWLGASIQALDGSPVQAEIGSLSGANWNRAAVPEPTAVALLALGMGVVMRRRLMRDAVAPARLPPPER
jgi:hypothetical protein